MKPTLKELAEAIGEVQRTLEDRALEAEVQQKAFDQLYGELRQYKEDFLFKAEKPMLLDLLLFFDSLCWFNDQVRMKEASPEIVAVAFQHVFDEFLEILSRRDIAPMEQLSTFDRTRHRAIESVATSDPSLDQTIVKVLKRGFTRGDRVLRAEEVIVNRKITGEHGN